jgi:hypothetical protein
VEVFGEAQFARLQSSFNAVERNATGNFEGKWKNTAQSRAIEQRVNSCASARSILLDIVAWDLHRRPFHEVPGWRLLNSRAFFFVSGMTIDADGAPNAYNPDDTGLDELANAGAPAHWNGIITDRDGNPLIQQRERSFYPFPGYYISCTSLSDKTKKFTDPTGLGFRVARLNPVWPGSVSCSRSSNRTGRFFIAPFDKHFSGNKPLNAPHRFLGKRGCPSRPERYPYNSRIEYPRRTPWLSDS